MCLQLPVVNIIHHAFSMHTYICSALPVMTYTHPFAVWYWYYYSVYTYKLCRALYLLLLWFHALGTGQAHRAGAGWWWVGTVVQFSGVSVRCTHTGGGGVFGVENIERRRVCYYTLLPFP